MNVYQAHFFIEGLQEYEANTDWWVCVGGLGVGGGIGCVGAEWREEEGERVWWLDGLLCCLNNLHDVFLDLSLLNWVSGVEGGLFPEWLCLGYGTQHNQVGKVEILQPARTYSKETKHH